MDTLEDSLTKSAASPENNWDIIYKKDASKCWGPPSASLHLIQDKLQPNSSVLDIGCGKGRNTIYMAELGHQVSAVDPSGEAIKELKDQAEQRNLQIHMRVGEFSDYTNSKRKFDLVICNGVLNSIQNTSLQEKINLLKSLTKPNGFILVSLFVESNQNREKDSEGYTEILYPDNQLYHYFIQDNWSIFNARSYLLYHNHHELDSHPHNVNCVVARNIVDEGKKTLELSADFPLLLKEVKHSLVSTFKKGDYLYNLLNFGEHGTYMKPDLIKEISDGLYTRVQQTTGDFDKLVAISPGGVSWSVVLASQLEKELSILRPELSYDKETGEVVYCLQKERERSFNEQTVVAGIEPGETITLLDDVISTGSTIISCIELLKKRNVVVKEIMCLAVKGDSYKEISQKYKIPITFLVKVSVGDHN